MIITEEMYRDVGPLRPCVTCLIKRMCERTCPAFKDWHKVLCNYYADKRSKENIYGKR